MFNLRIRTLCGMYLKPKQNQAKRSHLRKFSFNRNRRNERVQQE